MSILVSTAPLVIVKDRRGSHVYLYKGQGARSAALDADDVKRLVDGGYLVEKAASDADAADTGKPATVKDVLADVGDDKAKAAAALEAEQARGDDARSSLVEKLQAIVDAE